MFGTPFTRRHVLKASGVTLASVTLLAGGRAASGARLAPAAPMAPHPAVRLAQAEKPVFVAEERNALAYSTADNLFWNDVMMEHALFLTLLLPGAELEQPRNEAEQFRKRFADQFAQAQNIDADNFVTFNQSSIAMAEEFRDWKLGMGDRQASGQIHGLAWPSFYEHTAREADRFARRLESYNRNEIEFERGEVVGFWSPVMSDHAIFIVHLLDPSEEQLKDRAEEFHQAFAEPAELTDGEDPVMAEIEQIIDFKTAAEQGIREGKIRSIIHPALAAHVRREAVRFGDELRRAGPPQVGAR